MSRLIVNCSVEKLILPTYPQPPAEEPPMFAENRVHQRTNGCPYPNKVVMRVERGIREDRAYTAVRLENEYLRIVILPELGGRIYSALDKTTGYDFFYKQHVIKPALIGALGSWVSGGVEFNWPFHHRPSGFMPCDFKTETLPDGSAVCYLSEHDPIDRMRGTVAVILRPGESRFETRVQLYNRTPETRSFLWWENAAVPVNKDYQIFFPQDVTYVNFHYLKSRTTFPVAGSGVYNGIPMNEPRDITWHRNIHPATSYFSSASDYDFFGGYDHGRRCGVVHIGDHHLSPGKKLFTWGYGPLSEIWENALTDSDGAYAELMAGSYSDNQPDFAWLAPYETKQFSQYWYPICEIGAPTFANLDCAFRLEREDGGAILKVQSTASYDGVEIRLIAENEVCFEAECGLTPGVCRVFRTPKLPPYVTVSITAGEKTLATYTERKYDDCVMPQPIENTPSAAAIGSVEELYLAGVHLQQYRDPAVMPDAYWKEALRRDARHIPSLIAMAAYELNRCAFASARGYAERAIRELCRYNCRPQSGEAYYVYARILEQTGEYKAAYDYYYKAAWAADCTGKAMTRLAVLDMRKSDLQKALGNAETALCYGRDNSLAAAVYVLASLELGNRDAALAFAQERLQAEPLDHMLRYLTGVKDLYAAMSSDAAQTCLDLAFDFSAMGRFQSAFNLLKGLIDARPEHAVQMALYTMGWLSECMGCSGQEWYSRAKTAALGPAYPSRPEGLQVLSAALGNDGADQNAALLLGCLYYSKRHYKRAAELWEGCTENAIADRNLAVAYFSHLDRPDDARRLMRRALARNESEQLLYETAVLLDKTGAPPEEKIELLGRYEGGRDDILIELAKAYNEARRPDDALRILQSHVFVPCEGGEHAVADQYMFAYLLKGKIAFGAGKISEALQLFREGQRLPAERGVAVWNSCKLVPLRYHEAMCLERLGQGEAAAAIYRDITGIEREYFSNMYLIELPYYQAKAFGRLGEPLKARRLTTEYRRKWEAVRDTADDGFFGTTPFFISFVDPPQKLRYAQYLWLTALCEDCMGNGNASRAKLEELLDRHTENLTAMTYLCDGFPE